jgi:hypothetical protein
MYQKRKLRKEVTLRETEKLIQQVLVGTLRSNGHFISPNKMNPVSDRASKAEHILSVPVVTKFLLI